MSAADNFIKTANLSAQIGLLFYFRNFAALVRKF